MVGVSTTIKNVVRMMMEVTGTSLEPIFAPQGDWFGHKNQFFGVKKAEKILEFKSEVPLKEGLKRYFEWRKKKVLHKE